MRDKLKYRIPGKEEVIKSGRFYQLDNASHYGGFLVSDFDQSQLFGFEEGHFDLSHEHCTVPYCLSKEEYLIAAEKLIHELNTNVLDKVVFSRVIKKECVLDPTAIYNELIRAYPNAFIYQIESAVLGNWIGATPEILLKSNANHTISTVSLAGTKLSTDASEWGAKEKEEQAFVTDYIEYYLSELNVNVKSKTGPVEHLAGPVKHLKTTFTFDDTFDKWEVIKMLHPTPAVCGIPVPDAMNWIGKNEPHKRKLYAGMIGELSKECNMYVNLRCMQLIDNNAFLFVGGGFTKDSIPELEWHETERKANTLLNVLKIS